jgi:hypothetical protein
MPIAARLKQLQKRRDTSKNKKFAKNFKGRVRG